MLLMYDNDLVLVFSLGFTLSDLGQHNHMAS